MKNNNTEIPDGFYVCKTTDIIHGINKEEYKTINWILVIMEGPHKDKIIDKPFTLKSEKVKNFLLKELHLAELSVNNGAELESRKTELYGKYLMIEAKMNDSGFPAFYVKGLAKSQEEKPKDRLDIDW